jgi:hypothetical protein
MRCVKCDFTKKQIDDEFFTVFIAGDRVGRIISCVICESCLCRSGVGKVFGFDDGISPVDMERLNGIAAVERG